MTYTVSITKKGQMTLPKAVRDALDINTPDMILLDFDDTSKTLQIQKAPDILSFAGKYKSPKGMTALKAREYMETHYKRA
ncbi:MAG: hypothetical protein A2666_01225 [Parcubacteria group bacterium RIFCSPHIGHO2_01_FULL_47_10b]|nr:MAG: hypothetical protein A2666_01225 [Parcubacteria group bacterium RIFCSPHIGHO2_01_FULL_47_10b]